MGVPALKDGPWLPMVWDQGRAIASMSDSPIEPTPSRPTRSRPIWVLLGLFWFGAVVTGLSLLARYDNGAGVPARAPQAWPRETQVVLDETRPTLVMLAHPRCVCTRASLAELAELMARATHRPKAYVVFIKPRGVDDSWEHTDLWRSAAAIPGVTVLRDDHGVESQRFGAATSGQTLLYAPDGHLLFSGGTTGARGHIGDNNGRAAFLSLLNDKTSDRASSPVFGCPLFGTHDEIRTAPPGSGDGHQSN